MLLQSNGSALVQFQAKRYVHKGPFLYYVRVKRWVGGIAKYLLFLTGVGGWFWITLTKEKKAVLLS